MVNKPFFATLKKRPEFLVVSRKGFRFFSKNFIIQTLAHDAFSPHKNESFRIGCVVTKRVGKAVIRNKAKRRIKAIFRTIQAQVPSGYDYIIVAKDSFVTEKYDLLVKEVLSACKKSARQKARLYV